MSNETITPTVPNEAAASTTIDQLGTEQAAPVTQVPVITAPVTTGPVSSGSISDLLGAFIDPSVNKLEGNLPFYAATDIKPLPNMVVNNANVLLRQTTVDNGVLSNIVVKDASGVYSFEVHKDFVTSLTGVGQTMSFVLYKAQREIVAGSKWFMDGNCYAPDLQADQILKGNMPNPDPKRVDAKVINLGDPKIYAIPVN